MFGIQLAAIQSPVYSYFITPLDAQMTKAHWNRLETGALIFDPSPARGTTVLGRPTNSAYTWYATKPEWEALRSAPDPVQLRAAGYRYVYLDNGYWDEIGLTYQKQFTQPCVKQIDEVVDGQNNFRRLLDIDACQ